MNIWYAIVFCLAIALAITAILCAVGNEILLGRYNQLCMAYEDLLKEAEKLSKDLDGMKKGTVTVLDGQISIEEIEGEKEDEKK